MLRLIMRGVGLLILIFLLVPAGFSKNPAENTDKDPKKADDTTVATSSSDATSPADPATADAAGAADTSSEAAPADPASADPAQNAAKPKKGTNSDTTEAPKFTPLPATTGTIGLFTLETGDTLPKGGFAFSGFGNKFGRMPGSVTILELGVDASYGVTDNFNIYGSYDPYGHVHVGCPGQLSLRSIPLSTCNPVDTGIASSNSFFPSVAGSSPGYVEDYPFASNDNGGKGYVTFGAKYAFVSELHGAPFSFSVRDDFVISTITDVNKLLKNGTQASPLMDTVSLALSKKFGNAITGAFNFGYTFVRAPRGTQDEILIVMPDQVKVGLGFLFLPDSRIQPMMEYSGTIFTNNGNTPPDNSFGARDPVEGVWGVRVYPWKNIGFDIGYRYIMNLRNSVDQSGFVLKMGGVYWPEHPAPIYHPPTIACTEDKETVFFGSGDTVTITCTANNPDNNPLSWTWTTPCGRVDGTGPQVRWLSADVPVGSCTITAKADDGKGGTPSASVTVRVEPRPNRPPTISCSADRSSVFVGERVHITTNASDPDGDPLTYTWRTNGGQIVGSGAAVDVDTTGVAPGNYTVTVRVDDGRGGAADCSSTIEVKAVPPPPQASKISDCAFGKALSTRIDNVCKRILDDVALRLQNEPRGSAVIIGYSDPKETKTPDKVASARATNAVKYLGEKGIDPSRVSTRTGAGQAGENNNRRIDVIWVPEGATY